MSVVLEVRKNVLSFENRKDLANLTTEMKISQVLSLISCLLSALPDHGMLLANNKAFSTSFVFTPISAHFLPLGTHLMHPWVWAALHGTQSSQGREKG